MTGPAKYGLLVYSNNIKALSAFYAALFSMAPVRETPELISLVKDGFNIIIHKPPVPMPQPEFNSVKLFMTVENLAAAQATAIELGGQAFAGEWSNPLFSVCNIADPDGNHIQLRQFVS